MNKISQVLPLFAAMMLISQAALAQDPLQVGPDIYKLLFENERVRVMKITFKPGDKIAMHSHPDHLAYFLTGGKLVLSYPDGSSKDFEGKAGDVVWIGAEEHAAENVGTSEVKGVVVELKEMPQPVEAEELTPEDEMMEGEIPEDLMEEDMPKLESEK